MKKFLALLLAMAMIFALAACGGGSDGEDSDGEGGLHLAYALSAEPTTFDSTMIVDSQDVVLGEVMQEGLYKANATGGYDLGLAESVDISEDGLTYVYHLRDTAWSNGDPVTAQDFEFAFKRLADPDSGAGGAWMLELTGIKNAAAILYDGADIDSMGVKALDEKTLELQLEFPVSYMSSLLRFPVFAPINQAFFEEVGDQFGKSADAIITCGAFKMSEWEPGGTTVILEKNEHYYDADNVAVEEMTFIAMKDTQTAVMAFEKGEIDAAIHLYLGTSEEAGMQDILYYKERYPLPEFSLVPDAGFPGSIGEFGMLRIKFTAEKAFSAAIKALEAGTALNIVPDKATAELAVDGGTGCADIAVSGGTVCARGASSHAASPQNGRNAIKLLTDYLKELDSLPEEDRAVFSALSLVNADCYGRGLGIGFTHERYGSTVFSGTLLRMVDGHAEVSCDCRFAIGDNADRITAVLEKMAAENGLRMEVISSKPCSFKDPARPVIRRLKEVYEAFTGEECTFEISRGGTYAGRMENAFGTGAVLKREDNPALRDMAGHGGLHQPDECIPADGFVEGVKLLSDMLLAVDETV